MGGLKKTQFMQDAGFINYMKFLKCCSSKGVLKYGVVILTELKREKSGKEKPLFTYKIKYNTKRWITVKITPNER